MAEFNKNLIRGRKSTRAERSSSQSTNRRSSTSRYNSQTRTHTSSWATSSSSSSPRSSSSSPRSSSRSSSTSSSSSSSPRSSSSTFRSNKRKAITICTTRPVAKRQHIAADKKAQDATSKKQYAYTPEENVWDVVSDAIKFVVEKRKFLPWFENSCHFSCFVFAELVSYAKIGMRYWKRNDGSIRPLSALEAQMFFLFQTISGGSDSHIQREARTLRRQFNENTPFRNANISAASFADAIDHLNLLVSESYGRRRTFVNVEHRYKRKSEIHSCNREEDDDELVHLKWIRIRDDAHTPLTSTSLITAIKKDSEIRHMEERVCSRKSQCGFRCRAQFTYKYISHDFGDVVVLAIETPQHCGYPTRIDDPAGTLELTCALFCDRSHYKAVGCIDNKWFAYDDIPNSLIEVTVGRTLQPSSLRFLKGFNPWLLYYVRKS